MRDHYSFKLSPHFLWNFFFFGGVHNCIVLLGFCPRESQVAFSGESQLWQSHATQSVVHAGCFNISIIHQTLTWTTWFLTCAQMLMHAIACGIVWTPKESMHWKLTLGENPLPHQGIEPASAAYWFDALPTELHPRQLNFGNRQQTALSIYNTQLSMDT